MLVMPDELLALISADLQDDVARCAAAAGYRLVLGDARDCRREWLRARAVVADPDAVRRLVEVHPPRRDGLVIVSDREPPPDVWRCALDLGADHAAVLPADESRLVGSLSGFRTPRRHPAGAVAVIGGHGGAGATTLAAALALTAVDHGERVLLLDVDNLGAGIDLTLGIEDRPGLRWQDLSLESGTVSGPALHEALPRVNDRLSVLAPRREDTRAIRADAVAATIDAGRANGDVVIVDTPRGDPGIARVVVDSVDVVAVLTCATVSCCAATRNTVNRVIGEATDAALVIRGPAPSGLRGAEIAATVGLRLLASYRTDGRMPARLDAGRLTVPGRSSLGKAAAALCRHVIVGDRMAS